MQRFLLIISSVIFIFLSCQTNKDKKIISKSNFTKLLGELQLVDAYLNTLPIDSSQKIITSLYQNVFDQYGLDKKSFKNNVDYYAQNAEDMGEIYTNVEKNLNEQNTVYTKIETDRMDSVRVVDSIKMAKESDSVQRIVRLKSQYQIQLNNLIHVIKPTRKLTYREAQDLFYQSIGVEGAANLQFYINRLSGGPGQDVPVTPVTEVIQPAVSQPAMNPPGVPLKRLERPDMQALPMQEETKPVPEN